MDATKKPAPTRRDFVAGVAATGLVGACGLSEPAAGTRGATPSASALKPIAHLLSASERHWVGDGFHVSTIFSPRRLDANLLSPFILLDHAAPKTFAPSNHRRGVGEHPHRGFETVTFAYQGEIDHRDSHGGGGTIGSGDVQWMTAASGVVHEEMHSQSFAERGGAFEMVQLWVNLPARLKMTTPRYQGLSGATFPELRFGRGSGRLIAGTLQGQQGPAQTHTPMTIFDFAMPEGSDVSFDLRVGHTALVLLLEGRGTAQRNQDIEAGDVMVFAREQPGSIALRASSSARALVLSGEPLDEPVVAQGPFVMNTQAEIVEAIRDYRNGLMGTLAPRG